MKTLALIAAAGILGLGLPAQASEKLAQEKQCMQCHAIDKDSAGPSFKKIAAHWKGKKNAEKTLINTIRKGSDASTGNHWGPAKMPDDSERPLVSGHEARTLVRWILKQ